jgi:hypothetical protein
VKDEFDSKAAKTVQLYPVLVDKDGKLVGGVQRSNACVPQEIIGGKTMMAKHVRVKDGFEEKRRFLLRWAEGKRKEGEKA